MSEVGSCARDGCVLRVRFRWPGSGPSEFDNFFLGIWHPSRTIDLQWTAPPPCRFVCRSGGNWFLASAASPLHAEGTGLVHSSADRSLGVAFRGYVLPRLQSYSTTEQVLEYWKNHLWTEHNGVFGAAVIGPEGKTLTLLTDALGMGAVYYTTVDGAVLFSTNPRYLVTEEVKPDLLAWRSLLQTSWIVGDRSLSEGVRRVGPGQAVCVSGEGSRTVPWFDFRRIPTGVRGVGPSAVAEVEEAFQRAMSRLLEIPAGAAVLPLSSGFDSRRILASLMDRRVDFRAMTCRVFQKGHRDLDARFAAEMARDFGFAHTVVEPESSTQYVADDRTRRVLVDAETRDHTWAVRIMEALPRRPSLFFDGIGGDILGDPVGWSAHVGLDVGERSGEDDIGEIAVRSITAAFDSVLAARRWPSAAEVREALAAYLRPFVPRANLAEVAFLLLRQRRTIALWSQQLVPPGHVVVCPYLDLDYLRLLLEFSSEEKHATKFQRACLREFWPDLYKYHGNRDVPESLPAEAQQIEEERALACYAALYEDVRRAGGLGLLRRLLTPRGQLLLGLSRYSLPIRRRSLWHLHPLTELVWRQLRLRPCWYLDPN